MHEQVGNFSRHMEIKNNLMRMQEMKKLLTEKRKLI